jgi:hypothetical protein
MPRLKNYFILDRVPISRSQLNAFIISNFQYQDINVLKKDVERWKEEAKIQASFWQVVEYKEKS